MGVSKLYQYKGEIGNIRFFANKYNINYSTLNNRLSKGWSIEEAIEKPLSDKIDYTLYDYYDLSLISERDLKILQKKNDGKTFAEIGKEIGISAGCACAFATNAIKKLRGEKSKTAIRSAIRYKNDVDFREKVKKYSKEYRKNNIEKYREYDRKRYRRKHSASSKSKELTEREATILKMKQQGMSQTEIACKLGCSRQNVSSILKLAEAKDLLKSIDLTGQRFGKLTVISKTENKGKGTAWLCRCDCGNETIVLSSNLKRGKTRSCGCTKKQIDDLSGKIFGHLKVLRLAKKEGKRTFYECLCDCGETIIVNRDSLVRGATISCGHIQKMRSKENTDIVKQYYVNNTNVYAAKGTKKPRNNTSGVKGVCKNKAKNKYSAYITFQKKRYFLGYYDKIEDAAKARKTAEDKLHGDFLKWFAEEFPERWEKINKNKGDMNE